MDPSAIQAIVTALGAGVILREIVKFLLSRGKVRVDQAYQIREELRDEIKRKNIEIDTLDKRVDVLEAELEKAEADRSGIQVAFGKYKLDVYRALMEAGVDRELLNTVLAIQ